jgi:hypothetical protein
VQERQARIGDQPPCLEMAQATLAAQRVDRAIAGRRAQ